MEDNDIRGLNTLPWLKLANGVLEVIAELGEVSSFHLTTGDSLMSFFMRMAPLDPSTGYYQTISFTGFKKSVITE